MNAKADQPKTPESKPDAKDDLKSLPLAEVEKKLGSSPDGLTQAEAAKRLTQYGPNEIEEKKTNPLLKFLSYFWGPIPWMIEAAVILSAVARHWPDFGIILVLLLANAVVGFWEEREAGNAIEALKAKLAIKARVKRDGKWVNPAARELVPGDVIRIAPGRHRAGGCALAGRRSGGGGSVRADRRVVARHAQTGRGGVFRFDHPPGRDRRAGLCHGCEHLFRQDRGTGAGRAHRQPFSKGGAEDRQLPDHSRGGAGGGDHCRRDLPRRPDPHHLAVRPGADRGRDSRGDAHGVVGHDGGRRAPAREEGGDRQPAGGDRGTGGRGRAVRGQDRHPDPEQAHAGRSVQRERYPCRASHPRRRAGVARGRQGHHRPGRAGRPERRPGPEGLPGGAFPAVRPGAQAHRSHRQGRGRKAVQGDQGRAAGDPGAGGQCRRGQVRRRQGGQRIRGARLSFAGRRPGRRGRQVAASSACCPCSIRRGKTPRQPSRPRWRWA